MVYRIILLCLIQVVLIAGVDGSARSSLTSLIGWLRGSSDVEVVGSSTDEKEDNQDFIFLPSPILTESLNSSTNPTDTPATTRRTRKAKPTSSLLLFLQGALIDPIRYKIMFEHIQSYVAKKYNFELHVGIGAWPLTTDPDVNAISQDLLRKSIQELQELMGDNDDNNNNNDPTEVAPIEVPLTEVPPTEDTTDQPPQQFPPSFINVDIVDSVFLSGHSLGGIIIATKGSLSFLFDGLLLFGASMNSKGYLPYNDQRSLASYPKPVLTVSGDRNGFLRYLALAKEIDNLEENLELSFLPSLSHIFKQVEFHTLLEKPVIIIPGMTHAQVGDGIVNAFTQSDGRSDLDTYLELEDSWDALAEIIAQFLLTHTTPKTNEEEKGSRRQRKRQGKQLRKLERRLVQNCRNSMDSVAVYRYLSSQSHICKFSQHVQEKVANVKANKKVHIMPQFHDDADDFLYSKPNIFTRNGMKKGTRGINVHLVEQEQLKLHPKLKTQQVSPTIAIKCKSNESVVSQGLSRRIRKVPMSLRQLNEETMQTVLTKYVTKQQRERYEKFGRQLRFAPDNQLMVGPEWVASPLKLVHNDDEGYSTLSSPFFTSPVDTPLKKFAGMYYGKPLTPSQAYEWIVFDAFKKIPISNDESDGISTEEKVEEENE